MPIANYRVFPPSTRSLAFTIGFGTWSIHPYKNGWMSSLPEPYIVFSAWPREGHKRNRLALSTPLLSSKSIGWSGWGCSRGQIPLCGIPSSAKRKQQPFDSAHLRCCFLFLKTKQKTGQKYVWLFLERQMKCHHKASTAPAEIGMEPWRTSELLTRGSSNSSFSALVRSQNGGLGAYAGLQWQHDPHMFSPVNSGKRDSQDSQGDQMQGRPASCIERYTHCHCIPYWYGKFKRSTTSLRDQTCCISGRLDKGSTYRHKKRCTYCKPPIHCPESPICVFSWPENSSIHSMTMPKDQTSNK